MEEFVHRENLKIFKRQLALVKDEAQRRLLLRLLAEEEAKALRVHAMAEGFRARLSGEQSQELREFFAEEMTRATAALG